MDAWSRASTSSICVMPAIPWKPRSRMTPPDRRTGGQSQHSALLDIANRSDRVQRALAFARQHLGEPLSNDRLAAVACLSPRQFTRVFRSETGRSPAKVIEKLRLEKARFLLEQGRLPVEVI